MKCYDPKKSIWSNLSAFWAWKSSTLRKVYATWWITILTALPSRQRSKSTRPIVTTAKRSSSSTSSTLSSMSEQERDLMEEQERFDDLVVTYRKLQQVAKVYQRNRSCLPTCGVDEAIHVQWLRMYSSIPTTFLIELQETVNERQIILINQWPRA